MTDSALKKETEIPQILIEKIQKPNGDILYKQYTKGQFLGKGGFATVHRATCMSTLKIFAAKAISKSFLSKTRTRQKVMSEIRIHRSLHHDNIVQFHGFFEDDDFLYILLELCQNQTLGDLVRRRKRLLELEVQSILLQVLVGLKYLHSHRVIHRDLKLGNIFLDETMELKIADFGLSAKLEFEGERKRTICGTPNYMAPEILEGKFGHSYECDIWSFGVIMYTLLIGHPPFETKDVKTTYRRIRLNLYNFPESVSISEEAKSLISSILVVDFSKRPTLDQILEHDFFTKNLVPKFLPTSILAIPLSSGYIKQFESRGRSQQKEVSVVRASTQEHITQASTPSPTSNRPHSRNPEKPLFSESRPLPCCSGYLVPHKSGPDMWVKTWLESSKYGLGYILSNNWIGVTFNDKTKIISDTLGENMQYVSVGKGTEQIVRFRVDEFPEHLYKKVMLMQMFKKQLRAKELEPSQATEVHYLKNWMKTAHCMLFRLSNKVIQVCFNDGTELLFSSQSKNVTYITKTSEIISYPLSTAIDLGNKEMVKRIKYSKELLVTMLKGADKPI